MSAEREVTCPPTGILDCPPSRLPGSRAARPIGGPSTWSTGGPVLPDGGRVTIEGAGVWPFEIMSDDRRARALDVSGRQPGRGRAPRVAGLTRASEHAPGLGLAARSADRADGEDNHHE